MSAPALLRLGNIVPVPNMRVPLQGAQCAPFVADFTNTDTLEGDLRGAFDSGAFDYAQCIFIDNKDNASTFTLTMPGTGQKGFAIQAQPYSQGLYPITCPQGDGRFTAHTVQGQIISICFYNVPMPLYTSGPASGVLVVPALTNLAVDTPSVNGNKVLIAGVALQTIKIYRMILDVDNPLNARFYSNAGGTLLFGPAFLTAGGSVTMQASGVPWMTTLAGQDYVVNGNAVVNMGGSIGYVQS